MNCLNIFFLALIHWVWSTGPNFEDINISLDEPIGETTDIEQNSPQSNSVHISHNVPKGSKITIKQNNAYNSSVHISLNIARYTLSSVKGFFS